MDILLTNDDGIHAEGLWALHDVLRRGHAVTVIAPDRERTAVSHGITLHHPLRANRMSSNGHGPGYAVNGTPADCIKLGILEILGRKPDLVVSGLNPGANVGVNINYSGTVAAAKEAALEGYRPSPPPSPEASPTTIRPRPSSSAVYPTWSVAAAWCRGRFST